MLTILDPVVRSMAPDGRIGYSVGSWVDTNTGVMAGFAFTESYIMLMIGSMDCTEPMMVAVPVEAWIALGNALRDSWFRVVADAN